ncbi:MAG: hypothetical protein HC899_36575 [Leptolyngbyaceae cyanobacterium SM1_4_3]|nr:hypothetical protein [Leptolyngbyaceae cyanobacterium SM1_4_3]
MSNNKPTADYGYLHVPGERFTSPIEVGSERWFRWLDESGCTKFGVKTSAGSFTAQLEGRRGESQYWYAYKRKDGRLRKLYMGRTEDLMSEKLNRCCWAINTSDEDFYNYKPKKQQPEKLPNKSVTSQADSDAIAPAPLSREQLQSIANELLADPELTRKGKDRGTVKRALAAFINHLSQSEAD